MAHNLCYNQNQMLDIRFIRENAEAVQKNAEHKGYKADVAKLLELDEERKNLQQQVDELREKRNINASKMQSGKPESAVIDEGKQLKIALAEREKYLSSVSSEFSALLNELPNMIKPDVPIGDEGSNVEIKQWGGQPNGARDHLDYALERDWVDFEKGAKVAGAKFYYLKGDLALLENAITQFALDFVTKKDFTLLTVPHMVNSKTAEGAGFAPKSSNESNEYFIEGEDLTLIGTAEAPLTGYHMDDIIDEDKLPLFYVGLSPCYRKEAGTYGKHSRGLFRVHQFNKLEMYAFTTPEASEEVHEKIREIEEEIWQALGVPYHIINIASGDLGAPAAKKYDLEYWSSVDNEYRELTSCSNCTDFQARNLNIRVRRQNGSLDILHTLNGTAVSLARSLIAIIEHNQRDDGKLNIPASLRPYLDGREVL